MNRCSSCILIDSYPGIRFDEHGRCNYCVTHRKKKYLGEDALREILERQRAKKEPYDAVVGVSGGRDSAYVLHYLVRVAKLRVLAYFYDNGLVPPIARQNLKNMTDALGVELVTAEGFDLRKCMRNNFSAWAKKPCVSFILLTCTICNGRIEIGLRKTAKRNGVSLVVTGSGGIEEPHFKNAIVRMGGQGGGKNHLALAAGIVWDVLRNPRYLKSPRCLWEEGRAFLYQYLPVPVMQKLFYPNQTLIKFFDYIEFDEQKIHRVIENELGWKKPTNVASPWRFDCKLSFLKNWIFLNLFDFTEKDDLFSSMIREGLLSREQALERIKAENIIPEELVVEACREANLDIEALREATRRLRASLEAERKTSSV